MLNKQNDHAKSFPEYIEINHPDAALFPNGSLMSWKQRKKEREKPRRPLNSNVEPFHSSAPSENNITCQQLHFSTSCGDLP